MIEKKGIEKEGPCETHEYTSHCVTGDEKEKKSDLTFTLDVLETEIENRKGDQHHQTPRKPERKSGKERPGRPGKLSFSDVSVFYFNRTQGYGSIPRDGVNTIGMDMKHMNHQKMKLSLYGTHPVKRRLFTRLGKCRVLGKDWKKEESRRGKEFKCLKSKTELPTVKSCPSDPGEKEKKARDHHSESVFNGSENSQQRITNNKKEERWLLFGPQNNFDRTKISEGLFQHLCFKPGPTQMLSNPEKKILKKSPAFKHSLNVGFSKKKSAFPWQPIQTPNMDPKPATKHKHSTRPDVEITGFGSLRSSQVDRSSKRISQNKSRFTRQNNMLPSKTFDNTLTITKLGKVTKKTETPRKPFLKNSESQGLARAFSKKLHVNLEELVDQLPKPRKKLVLAISRNCLRSFHRYHRAFNLENNNAVSEAPNILAKPKERGSNTNLKNARKMEECGTRGLKPLTPKARLSLLRPYGILNLDRAESEEIRDIQESREHCGCSCRGECLPDSCECAENGIECQVEGPDRPGFPCPCGPGCGNPVGRNVFDDIGVSLHFIDTMMNMEGVLDISDRKVKEKKLIKL
eukprot:GFUD01007572.1.p1 GENE.GFUD01007572.1~~GFUD01007572.1.p1  ORF type:complete len:625 (+),score=133.90 GFUD01007572.1:154-1875(+)